MKAKTKIFYLSSDKLADDEIRMCDGVFYKTDIDYITKLVSGIEALEVSREIKRR